MTPEREQKRILVAADDPARLGPLLSALATTPHGVTAASSAAAARELDRGAAFDLLIVGIEPPELAGFDIIRAWRRGLGKERPVLALSDGFKREHIEGMLENDGVRRLFTSDVRPEELLFWVNNALFPEAMRSRRAPRIPAAFTLSIAEQTRTVRGRAFTLSEDGLFLETAMAAAPGQVLELRFRLPGQPRRESLSARCEVVWSNPRPRAGERGHPPYGLGLRFTGLSEAARHAIKAFVLQNLLAQTI